MGYGYGSELACIAGCRILGLMSSTLIILLKSTQARLNMKVRLIYTVRLEMACLDEVFYQMLQVGLPRYQARSPGENLPALLRDGGSRRH